MLKKKKIDYINYIADLVQNDTKCVDFSDVKDDIVTAILPFLIELSESIEKDSAIKSKNKEQFTDEEISVLKTVALKLLTKPPEQPKPVQSVQNEPFSEPQKVVQQEAKKKAQEMSNNDKMNFAMNHRHLANKRVQVINDQNVQIFGNVVGLDAPYILVKTETGPTIQVPLEKVVPQ